MSAEIVWLLVTAALVLFMTPGLAFFYGGLVKAKSVVSMMMLSFGSLGLISVLWILYGFNINSITGTGADLIPGFAGNPLSDVSLAAADGSTLAGAAFGATFAIITVALISGAVADRARFGSWLLFAGIWATLSYFPIAGWVWALDADGNATGWIGTLGAALFGADSGLAVLDWAGGTAVHINAGAAALALALVLGKRTVFVKGAHKPHNVPLVLIGVAILWFGWFGFNTGAATTDGEAGLIFINTIGAPAAAVLGWLLVEKIKDGKPTSVGAASGAVAGLVAITPACAFLTPGWAIVLGLVAGAICALAVEVKYRWGLRRLARRRRPAPRRRNRRMRVPGLLRHRHRSAHRGRCPSARTAAHPRCRCGRVLVPRRLRGGNRDREDDRFPSEDRGRGRRYRPRRAR